MKLRGKGVNRIVAVFCALAVGLLSVGLVGCGMAVRSAATTLTIDETGKLREEIVEEQGSDSYTQEELAGFVEQEVELYNRGKDTEAVRLNDCTVQNGEVKISLEYASSEEYAAFNQVTCFTGTLQEAEDAGFEVERTWLDPDGAEGDMEMIRERFREWKVIILSEEINVKTPDKILYVSDNVQATGRLNAVVRSVRNEEGGTESSSEQTAGQQVTVHPLATVADRFAYIIYK